MKAVHHNQLDYSGEVPLAGVEPAIPGLEDRCLIHLATEAMLLSEGLYFIVFIFFATMPYYIPIIYLYISF